MGDPLTIVFECQKCRLVKSAKHVDIGIGGAQWCRTCVSRVAKALRITRDAVRQMERTS